MSKYSISDNQCEYPDRQDAPGDTCTRYITRNRRTSHGTLWLCVEHFDRPVAELFDDRQPADDGLAPVVDSPTYQELADALSALVPVAERSAEDMSELASDAASERERAVPYACETNEAGTAVEAARALLARIPNNS